MRTNHQFVALSVACFGMVCSFAWTLLNRGSKFWYENWEAKVERLEASLVGPLFAVVEPPRVHAGFWLRARRFSPSKLIIALSDYVFVMWFAIVAGEFVRLIASISAWQCIAAWGLVVFLALSVGYLILVARACLHK